MHRSANPRPVIVITGASSGIGMATAKELSIRGYSLVLAARREQELSRLAFQLDPSGSSVIAVPADVSDPSSRRNLIEQAHKHFGKIDVLINNAGVSTGKKEWWDGTSAAKVLEVNLSAPIELSGLVLPEMIKRGSGHIINIGSVAGHLAVSSIYSASKFGLRGFSYSLNRELAGSGVHVSLVSPGFVRSEMTSKLPFPMPEASIVAKAVAGIVLRPRRETVVPSYYRALILLENFFPFIVDKAKELTAKKPA